jgi:hypothetical protein
MMPPARAHILTITDEVGGLLQGLLEPRSKFVLARREWLKIDAPRRDASVTYHA